MTPFNIQTDESGAPSLHVGSEDLWDLVEFISYRRIAIWFHYDGNDFIMKFPHLDAHAAQELLEDWAHNESVRELAHAS